MLLLSLNLFSQIYQIEKKYFTLTNDINLSLVYKNIHQDVVLTTFENRSLIQIPKQKIVDLLNENGISSESKYPVIYFYKNKKSDYSELTAEIEKIYLENNKNLIIKSINVSPKQRTSTKDLILENIIIDDRYLKREKGVLKAVFKNKSLVKNILFDYEINGLIKTYESNSDIEKDEIISVNNTKKVNIPFKYYQFPLITQDDFLNIRAKRKVKEGEIIFEHFIQKVPDVIKDSKVLVVLKESGIKIEFFAVAKEDKKIGEMIEIEKSNGVKITGIVIDKNIVEIK